MNTDVQAVVVVDDDEAMAAKEALSDVETLFATVEATLSRFRPDSELSQLNRASAVCRWRQSFRVSALLFDVTAAALEAARETGGVFDPTVLGALVLAGYDRSFELLADDGPVSSTWEIRPGWDAVILDTARRIVALPPGVGLDLGGIGKGWTVDRAVQRLGRFPGFGLDAGGDLYCQGRQSDGSPWTVGVEDPRAQERDIATLVIDDRAVATSSVARRRWQRGGRQQHHLIDPRTGLPAETDVLSATVIAGSVARAEILAKVALILGSTAGLRFLNQYPHTAGILIRADGRVLRTADFSERLLCVAG